MTRISKYFNLIPGKVYELYSDYYLTKDTDIRFYFPDRRIGGIEHRELSVKKFIFLAEEDPMENKVGYPIKVFIDGKILYIGYQFPEHSGIKFKEAT